MAMKVIKALKSEARKPEPAKQRPKNTKQKILLAGRRIFAEKGYHQTRIQDLLKAAGVSPGAFYNYFSNKEELFLELVREAGEALRESVHEIRVKGIKVGNQDELFLVLIDSIRYFFEFVDKNRPGLLILFREQQTSNPIIMDTLSLIISEIHRDLKKDIQSGINIGMISVSDPGIAAWGVLSAISGVTIAYLNNPRIERDRLIRTLAELILLGLFRR